VEENEEELEKLKLWLKKVRKRDILEVPLYEKALDKVKASEKKFEDFAQRVYEHIQKKDLPKQQTDKPRVQKKSKKTKEK